MLALDQLATPVRFTGIGGGFELGGPIVASLEFAPFGANGVRTTTVPIAASPIWIGAPLWAQSLLVPTVGQPRFTNAVLEVVLP